MSKVRSNEFRRIPFCLHKQSLVFQAVVAFLLVGLVQAQTYSILHTFECGPNDGTGPRTGIFRDPQGNLYGTTQGGGLSGCAFGCGIVFKLSPNGDEKVLYRFLGSLNGQADGGVPAGGVVVDKAGNVYGTTAEGGAGCAPDGCGTIFKLSSQGTETIFHSFLGGTDGQFPVGKLVADDHGNLYGTAAMGGASNGGTVFRIAANGSAYTVLHSFAFDTEGDSPLGSLIRDKEGNLYGTTQDGGANGLGLGTVFKLDPAGTLTLLHIFTGKPDGADPEGGLIEDSAGNLYGTTRDGGGGTGTNCEIGCGVVFKIDPAGVETVLYTFSGGADGANPSGSLALDAAGNLYGTTFGGGFTDSNDCRPEGCGVVFQVSQSGRERVLHTFGESPGDGFSPFDDSVLVSGRSLYAATSLGGEARCGTVFEMTAR